VDKLKSKKRVTEADWVGIRLLYQILAADVSAQAVSDVKMACDYYEQKYGYRSIQRAFAHLVKDPSASKSFDDPSYAGARRIAGQNRSVLKAATTGEQHG